MSFQKNVSGQKWLVFAFDRTTNIPKTGDAANITAKIRKDYTSAVATNDVNPDELEDGYYEFTLTQTESNATVIDLFPESATTNIQVIGVPGRSFTTPPNANLLGINGSGHVSRVTVADSITGNVGGVATGGIVAGSFAADAITAAAIATDAGTTIAAAVAAHASVVAIKAKTDNLPASPAATGDAMTLAAGAISDTSFTVPAELAAVPAAVPGPLTSLQFLYQKVRNAETSDAEEQTIAMSDGTVIATAPHEQQGGVFTRGKYV